MGVKLGLESALSSLILVCRVLVLTPQPIPEQLLGSFLISSDRTWWDTLMILALVEIRRTRSA